MRTSVKGLFVAAIIMAAGSFCFGEQIDNPEYKNWSKFKAGTSVTSKMETSGTSMETTTTLLEISADKAVVESKMSMMVQGKPMEMPGQKREIPAKIEKVEPKADAPKADVKESTEEVELPGGKKVTAKVTETTMTANGAEVKSKVWTSDEVPGMMIKMESGATKMALTAMTIK